MTKSMTEGRPFQLMLQFALPLLVGNLLQQTYNIMSCPTNGTFMDIPLSYVP